MNGLETAAQFLDSLNAGVAVADAEDWSVVYQNERFAKWFDGGEETPESLMERIAGLDEERVRARLEKGRPFTYETEVRAGAREVTLSIQLRPEKLDGRQLVFVECQNVSKQKEVEYMLDSYSRLAEKKTRQLEREKERVEKLLLNVMPRSVYEEMKDFGATTPQRFDAATVLMLDFVGFTSMAVSRDPSALVAELNDMFSAFDRIVELYGCERIKTIGDAYMAVSGLPEANPEHASNIAKVAVRMRRYLKKRNASHPNQWRCRIGISTGPVIGSMVGIQKYVYDIFGPAVNLAARFEALSEPMQITLCADTLDIIRDDFSYADRGDFEVKGFGEMQLFSLEGEVGDRR